jgi:hypothetical protein
MRESDRQPRLSGLDPDDLFVFALDVANGRAF